MTRNEMLDILTRMMPSQFEIVISKLFVPPQLISGAQAAQATRATELLRYVEANRLHHHLDTIIQSLAHEAAIETTTARRSARSGEALSTRTTNAASSRRTGRSVALAFITFAALCTAGLSLYFQQDIFRSDNPFGFNSSDGSTKPATKTCPEPIIGEDDFANRRLLKGSVSCGRADLSAHVGENFEPQHFPGSMKQSAWWGWESPKSSSGVATFVVKDETSRAGVVIYQGSSLPDLVALRRAVARTTGAEARIDLPTSPDTRYEVAVDSADSKPGNVVLSVSFAPNSGPGSVAGSNDFARALALDGAHALGISNTMVMDRENFEPVFLRHSDGHDVWWRWTAPTSGRFTVRVDGPGMRVGVAVLTGQSFSELRSVPAISDSGVGATSKVSFDATASTAYRFLVDTFDSSSGNLTLRLDPG